MNAFSISVPIKLTLSEIVFKYSITLPFAQPISIKLTILFLLKFFKFLDNILPISFAMNLGFFLLNLLSFK